MEQAPNKTGRFSIPVEALGRSMDQPEDGAGQNDKDRKARGQLPERPCARGRFSLYSPHHLR